MQHTINDTIELLDLYILSQCLRLKKVGVNFDDILADVEEQKENLQEINKFLDEVDYFCCQEV